MRKRRFSLLISGRTKAKRTVVPLLLLILGGTLACGGGGSTPVNKSPIAGVSGVQTVNKRSPVFLDGSTSHDPEGSALAYEWTQTGGTAVVLSGATTAKPSFISPSSSGTLTFSLVVSDGKAKSVPEQVSVLVQNRLPIASAPPQVNTALGRTCVLDGSASTDPDGDTVTCIWTQTSGPIVSLQLGQGGRTASFMAPGTPATLTFSMQASDGEDLSQPVTVTVRASVNFPPVADAGTDKTVFRNSTVMLSGTGTDADNDPMTFQWMQVAGPAVSLLASNSASTSFQSPAVDGDLRFSLVANDGKEDSAPAYVTVHVANRAPNPPNLTLSPSAPKRGDAISVTATAVDPDGDVLSYGYVWKRNGTVVAGATGSAYPLGNQVKGDLITVEVTVSDGGLTASRSVNVQIVDSPARLTAPASTSVPYGQTASFTVIGDDPDGEPLAGPFEITHGPSGMVVSSEGQVSWTPSGPLFGPVLDANWGVRLKGDPNVTVTGKIKATDPGRSIPLMRTNIGIPRNSNCVEIQDFDGTSVKSALIGADTLYLLKKGPTGYEQSWVYPFDPGSNAAISAVAAGDVSGDGKQEIFFATGTLVISLDGTTRQERNRFGSDLTQLGGPQVLPTWTGLKLADVDGDGSPELIILSQEFYGGAGWLYVLDPKSFTVKQKASFTSMGTALAVANVDQSPELEIITSGGYVLDGATLSSKWHYSAGFGFTVDAGDVDGDGIAEIVGAVDWTAVKVFSAVLKSPVWEIQRSDIDAVRVADLDGQSPAEIIVGDGQWGNVTIYRYDGQTKSAKQLAQINSQDHGVSGIAVGDVDGDGKPEILWGSGLTSSGADVLVVASESNPIQVKWKGPSPQLDGPFSGAKLAKVAHDQDRLIFLTPRTGSGYQGQRVLALDPKDGVLSVSTEVNTNWSRIATCAVGDVLSLGFDQVLLGTANIYDDYVTAFDFISNTKRWSTEYKISPVALIPIDMNSDGTKDLVGLTSNGYIYVWDAAHQNLLWQSTSLGTGSDLAVADLDGDGVTEMIALTGTQMVVFAKSKVTGNYLESNRVSVNAQFLLVADMDGDGLYEVFALGSDSDSGPSTVFRFDATLQSLGSFSVPRAQGIYLEESPFVRKNLLLTTRSDDFTTGAISKVMAIDPVSGTEVWSSPGLPGSITPRSLGCFRLLPDGELYLSFGTAKGMGATR